jgi:glycine/D-amino acid oxidase-like deaminating enzyme
VSVSYWNDCSSKTVAQADVVIIGGGIAGLSSAYWIQREDPTMKIVVLEKYEIGAGATGRNAGFVTCGSVEHFNRLIEKHGEQEALEIWRFSEENMRLLKEHIIGEEGDGLLFEHRGSFSLASTDVEFKELQNSAQLMKKLNIQVDTIHEEEIEKRLGAVGFVGGIKYLDDGSIHPIKLLQQIRSKLGENVDVREQHEVFDIATAGEGKRVYTNKGRIDCSIVVYATNGYSPQLHKFFADKIFPTRGQILATAPVPRFMEGPCYANFVLDYFRQLPTGEMVIGGFRQLQKDVEKGYSDETSEIIQAALEEFLHKHIPSIRKAKITHRWSGIMGFSVDGQPMVGALPTDEQLYFVGGFTAHGLGLAFHSAKVLADSLFGRAIPKFISARRLA